MLVILPGGPGRRALQWEEAVRIDWGIILLYGGGMALGELSFSTGLAEALGRSLTGWLPTGPGASVALVAAAGEPEIVQGALIAVVGQKEGSLLVGYGCANLPRERLRSCDGGRWAGAHRSTTRNQPR